MRKSGDEVVSVGMSQVSPTLLWCLQSWLGWTHKTSAADVAFNFSPLPDHQHRIQKRRRQNLASVHIWREQLVGDLATPVEVLLGIEGQYLRSLTHLPSHLTQFFYLSYPHLHPLQVYCLLCMTSIYSKLTSSGPGMVVQEADNPCKFKTSLVI